MHLISFEYQGRVSYGTVAGDHVVDLGMGKAHPAATLRDAIATQGYAGIREAAAQGGRTLSLSAVRVLPPIPDPRRIVCVGLNYRAHAAEGGFKVPLHPSTFIRLSSTLVAHEAPMILPRVSTQLDYEGELAVVIGRPGRAIPRDRALEHVFGYACFNDGSIRDIQFGHSTTAGKNFPGTGAFGPCIATVDVIPDPSELHLTTRVNGAVVQSKSTSDMIFDVPAIVEYVSMWTALDPGDVIATGTPEGVGFARKPPLWLRAGDVVEIEITRIGTLRNAVVAEGVGE
jgi:2-keto-4-pentenoate hydratase/2-oxohepta-3-ene-1,7-dioic acid hydratase in catechol pathway